MIYGWLLFISMLCQGMFAVFDLGCCRQFDSLSVEMECPILSKLWSFFGYLDGFESLNVSTSLHPTISHNGTEVFFRRSMLECLRN